MHNCPGILDGFNGCKYSGGLLSRKSLSGICFALLHYLCACCTASTNCHHFLLQDVEASAAHLDA
jgi:hypothetical protein